MELLELVRTPGVLPTDPGNNRVMVVDDDLGQRAMLARIMRRAGYECSAAMASEEARKLLAIEAFGMVITDLRMWGGDGLDLARHIADHCANTYSIIVTGFCDRDLERRARQAGAYALVSKPFDLNEIVSLVSGAFEHRAQTVALRRHQA